MDEPVVKSPIKIVVRDFDPEQDEAFIYCTWRDQAYFSAIDTPEGDPKEFFRKTTRIIKEILKTAKVRIACLLDSPTTIIGYSVSTGDHLNWIYVKVDYREVGIGKMLWPKEIKTVTCYLTKIGAKIADKKQMILKENSNGTYH